MNNYQTFSGNSFLDENHFDLLEHLDFLLNIERNNWDPILFKDEFNKFILNIENHFHHEEIVLKGAGYTDLENHTIFHRDIALNLRKNNNVDFSDFKEASFLIEGAASYIIEHEMLKDQQYWPLFDDNKSNNTNLIPWSDKYETNNSEIDNHHIALLNHINRFYITCVDKEDIDSTISELKILCLYSKYHFEKEEDILGDQLAKHHKINHTKLIRDLETLIVEIENGKFQIKNLPDYLSYWLFDHLREYDIPAFANK